MLFWRILCVTAILYVVAAQELPAFDAAPIKSRLMAELDWSVERADVAIEEYRQFWLLHKKYPNEPIVPTNEVDEAWHAHILHTVKYAQDSNRYFGYFFHHHPDTPEDKSTAPQRFKRTRDLYSKEFSASAASTEAAGCGSCSAGKCKGGKEKMKLDDKVDKAAGCGSCSAGKCKGGKSNSTEDETAVQTDKTQKVDKAAGCGSCSAGKCKGGKATDAAGCGSCSAGKCKGGKASPTSAAATAAGCGSCSGGKRVRAAKAAGCGSGSCSAGGCKGGGGSGEKMSCSGGMMMGGGMATYFTWTMSQVVLFKWWDTQGETKYYVASVFVIVALVLFKEWLFAYRIQLAKDLHNSVVRQRAPPNDGLNAGLIVSSDETSSGQNGARKGRVLSFKDTWKIRLVHAVLGALNLVLGYFLMLIVMTYNNGFFIAIILAAAAGQFLFSMPWRTSAEDPVEIEADCCER